MIFFLLFLTCRSLKLNQFVRNFVNLAIFTQFTHISKEKNRMPIEDYPHTSNNLRGSLGIDLRQGTLKIVLFIPLQMCSTISGLILVQ